MIQILRKIQTTLQAQSRGYRFLEEEVYNHCLSAQKYFEKNIIREVIRRPERDDGRRLKEDIQIAAKYTKEIKKSNKFKIQDVYDIVALTIVVYYPDYINKVKEYIKTEMEIKGFVCTWDKGVTENGYFAHHIVMRSKNPDHFDLLCEIQLKTMLHSAWASKTHDLTYKPFGRFDARLDVMMRAFSDALQAIEYQSVILRQIISGPQMAERRLLQAAQKAVINWGTYTSTELCERTKELCNNIRKSQVKLRHCSKDYKEYIEYLNEISELNQISEFEAFWADALFAVICENERDYNRVIWKADSWLESATSASSTDRTKEANIWFTPIVLQACGRLDLAVSYSYEIINKFKIAGWTQTDRAILHINLANFLLELAYFQPAKSKEDVDTLKNEVRSLIQLAECLREEDRTAFDDTEGMFDLVFSEDPKTVRRAIDKITAGNSNDVPADLKEVSQAYFELHIRLAWRRLLELESRDDH